MNKRNLFFLLFLTLAIPVSVWFYIKSGETSEIDAVKAVKILGAELLAAQAEGHSNIDLESLIERVGIPADSYSKRLAKQASSGMLRLARVEDAKRETRIFVIQMDTQAGFAEWQAGKVTLHKKQ